MDMPELDVNTVEAENQESVLLDIKTEKEINRQSAEETVLLQDIVENDDSFPANEIEVVGEDIHYLLVNCNEMCKEEIIAPVKLDEITPNENNGLNLINVTVKKSPQECEPLRFDEKQDVEVKREISIPDKDSKGITETVQATIIKKTSFRDKSDKLAPRLSNSAKKWDAKLTRSLIEIRKEMDFSFKFRKDKNHNSLLWSSVLKQLIKKNPYSAGCGQITLVECADKWRSLLMTYKINLMKHKQYGEKAVTWEFFNDIHKWMRNDNSSEFSRLIKSSTSPIRDPVPKKKFRIEKTFEKVPQVVLGNKVIITKAINNSAPPCGISPPIVINQPTTTRTTNCNGDLSPDATADYHFAMLILKELEKLPPDIKKRKKQRILLALYE